MQIIGGIYMTHFLITGLVAFFLFQSANAANNSVAHGETHPLIGGETSGGTGVPMFNCKLADQDINWHSDIIGIAGDLHTGPQVHLYDRQNKITGWYDVSVTTPPASSGLRVVTQTNDGGSTFRLEITTQTTPDQMGGVLYSGKVVNATLENGSEIHDQDIVCRVQSWLGESPRKDAKAPDSQQPNLASSRPSCDRNGFGSVYGNRSILKFKNQNVDGFTAEAFVHGKFVNFVSGFEEPRLAIKIGPRLTDTIEVAYSSFAEKLPDLKKGEDVRACGRYETVGGAGLIFNTFADNAAYPGQGDGFLFIRGKKFE
jgi:hypothetical protein